MTDHYFENDLVNLHYYQFGTGPRVMLCFHGYGMHGKQFKLLEPTLGDDYTFYGFDLFFHKQTKLKDQSLAAIKKGITKKAFAGLISEFCAHKGIERFSILSYSMGTHYATVLVEEMASVIDEYIAAAPSCLNPGTLIKFFAKNKFGNGLLKKLAFSDTALIGLLKFLKRITILDAEAYKILYAEIGTAELRFNLYASFTYLRAFETDEPRFLTALATQNIKSIFIFGKRDKAFPLRIGNNFFKKLTSAEVMVLNEGHEMIKHSFAIALTELLLP
jgi:pimeloyl-ACP methyl ester carboxylesterase